MNISGLRWRLVICLGLLIFVVSPLVQCRSLRSDQTTRVVKVRSGIQESTNSNINGITAGIYSPDVPLINLEELHFGVEGSVFHQSHLKVEPEIGFTLIPKLAYPLFHSDHLFVEGGTGGGYTEVDQVTSSKLGGHLFFASELGVVYYTGTGRKGIFIEASAQHMSNASLDDNNDGLDTVFLGLGYGW